MTVPFSFEHVQIARLSRIDANNPNLMDAVACAKLAESIRRDGFTQPILVRPTDDGAGHQIVDGDHRVIAAEMAGLEYVPAVIIDCTIWQARALRVSMNRLRGELDLAAVGREFRGLTGAGWDVPTLVGLGFSDDEVSALLTPFEQADPEEMPTEFSPPPDPRPEQTTWTLEIDFESRAELNRAKRRLRKLAGKGAPLAAGLMKALAED